MGSSLDDNTSLATTSLISLAVKQGLCVLRFTNEEVLNHIERVTDRIAAYLPSPFGRRVGEEGLADRIGVKSP
jgi:very-short-patch-repair endonuclease